MSDAFDPNWPHGHLAKYGDITYPAHIKLDDLPGRLPLAVLIDDGAPGGWLLRMSAAGAASGVRLINAPAPVKHAEAWVNVYRGRDGIITIAEVTWGTRESAQADEPSTLIGSIRVSTADSEIIGPDGKPVKL